MSEPTTAQPLLWRRPWWAHARFAAAIWAALVAYGSLMPFQFDFARVGLSMFALSNATSTLADVALNLALYVPLGVMLRRAWRLWWPAVVGVCVLSYGLECAQGLTPGRVASWRDVAANATTGTAAALLTPWVARGFRTAAFACYRRGWRVQSTLQALRRQPWLLFAVVAVNVVLLGIWATTVLAPVRPSSSLATNWMPFGQHFARSYDKAAFFLSRSMFLYCGLGSVLCLTLMRRVQRRPLLWVALTMAVIVAVQEALRQAARHAQADITEPIIAVAAVALVFTTGWLFIHAVRKSCRRRQSVPVAVDRRRREHDYRFALTGPDNVQTRR